MGRTLERVGVACENHGLPPPPAASWPLLWGRARLFRLTRGGNEVGLL